MAGSLYAYGRVREARGRPVCCASGEAVCQDVRVRWSLAIPVVFLSLLWAGCGSDEAVTPTVCLESLAKLETALVTAPDQVLIDGTVPISGCMVRDQMNGDIVKFGSHAVRVATKLGTTAAGSGPEAIPAAIQVGYLVGAMDKASEESDGIHASLVGRVQSAATYRMSDSPAAQVHYDAGFEAGSKLG